MNRYLNFGEDSWPLPLRVCIKIEYSRGREREGGAHIINIGKTWEKLMLAARIIVSIENPEDVVAVSG
eukprot:602749-Amorphochlora_amoeboformis.AAC.2